MLLISVVHLFFLQFSLLGCTLWLKLRTISREVIIAENEFRLLVLCLYQTLCPQLFDREIQHYSSVQLSFHAKLLADTAIKKTPGHSVFQTVKFTLKITITIWFCLDGKPQGQYSFCFKNEECRSSTAANCWAKKSFTVKKGTLPEYNFKFSVLPFWAVAT